MHFPVLLVLSCESPAAAAAAAAVRPVAEMKPILVGWTLSRFTIAETVGKRHTRSKSQNKFPRRRSRVRNGTERRKNRNQNTGTEKLARNRITLGRETKERARPVTENKKH